MISKKNLLVTSGITTAILLVWNYVGNYQICDLFAKDGSIGNCPFILTNIGTNLLPVIPLFLLSLITYKMRDEVYRAWLRFTLVWVPLSMLAIFLAPEYTNDWMYPVVKGTVAFFSSLLFLLISLLLITWKYLSSRHSGRD